jgi:hypothetical protein
MRKRERERERECVCVNAKMQSSDVLAENICLPAETPVLEKQLSQKQHQLVIRTIFLLVGTWCGEISVSSSVLQRLIHDMYSPGGSGWLTFGRFFARSTLPSTTSREQLFSHTESVISLT